VFGLRHRDGTGAVLETASRIAPVVLDERLDTELLAQVGGVEQVRPAFVEGHDLCIVVDREERFVLPLALEMFPSRSASKLSSMTS